MSFYVETKLTSSWALRVLTNLKPFQKSHFQYVSVWLTDSPSIILFPVLELCNSFRWGQTVDSPIRLKDLSYCKIRILKMYELNFHMNIVRFIFLIQDLFYNNSNTSTSLYGYVQLYNYVYVHTCTCTIKQIKRISPGL